MTDLLHEREFSRTVFLKTSGALVIGFSIGAAVAGKAGAANAPVLTSSLVISGGNNPASWAPDPGVVDSWIAIHPDNTVSLMSCKCENGAGQMTSLTAILAEELDLNLKQVKFVTATTRQVNVGSTGGSSTTPTVGKYVRAAAVTARQALLDLASTRLGVPVTALSVSDGVISGGGRSVTYGELAGDRLLNVRVPASYGMTPTDVARRNSASGLVNGQAPAKPVSQYRYVGTSVPRVDVPAKVAGAYTYIHNLKIPGMVHGRIILPRGQTAYGVNVPVLSIDKRSIAGIPGVQVVRRDNFVGVVAAREHDAIRAASQLKVTWAETPASLPTSGNLFKHMRAQDSAGAAVRARYTQNTGNVDAALAGASKVLKHTYSWPYINRGLIGPSCAIADVKRDSALILSNSKNPHDTLNTVAAALGLPPTSVEVRFHEGASDYGWPIYNDAVVAAAVMSQTVGKPVRVQFMRWDEHGYENFAPPQLMDLRAGIDAQGNLVGWDAMGLGVPYYFYGPGDTVMQALGTKLPTGPHTAGQTPGVPSAAHYRIPSVRLLAKPLPIIDSGYLKTNYLRTPNRTGSTFASEQMIDALAHAAGKDPIEFRLQNLAADADRWIPVLNAVTAAAKWEPRVAASRLSEGPVVRGRGVGVFPSSGSFLAAIADIEVNKKTGKIVPKHLYISIDAGLAVNPSGVRNQVIGGAVQAVSWTLVEQVPFDRKRVTGLDWVTYPILRIKDAPKVTAIVIQRPEQPARGVGEESQPVAIGAIANAFFDATGVRMHDAPMSPARVRAVLKAAGVS